MANEDKDILRREYQDDDAGLFTSLDNRQLGFNRDTTTGRVTLVYKNNVGGRHDIGESLWEDGSAGYITPLGSNGLELSSPLVSTSSGQFSGQVSFANPVGGTDGVNLSYLSTNYVSKVDVNPQQVVGDFTVNGGNFETPNSIETDVNLKSLYLGDNISYSAQGGRDPEENYVMGRNITVGGKTHWMIGANQSADENCNDSFYLGNSINGVDSTA